MNRRRGRAGDAAALGAALLVLGPALAPGFVLVGDMVFTPRLPFSEALLGISSAAPRAVPSDLVVALASTVVPGQVVQKLVLLAILVAAGSGAARVLPLGTAGSAAAAVAFVWNPYVAERLALGQWAVLVGYAAVPWVLRASWRLGAGREPGAWWRVSVAAGLGSLGGAPGWVLMVLAAAPGYGFGAARAGSRRLAWVRGVLLALLLLALALPWALPALTRPGGTAGGSGGSAFRPRPDTPLGTVGSLLTGGGVWNALAVPAGRNTVVGALAALLVLVAGVCGLVLARRSVPGRDRDEEQWRGLDGALVVAALVGLLLALVVTPNGMADRLAVVPGGGLLRDGSRAVAPLVLAVAVGLGVVVDRIQARSGWFAGVGGPALAVLVALLPVAALPAAGWGLSGRLHAVDYPDDYAVVARAVSTRSGGVVVLPFEAYRRFGWNGGRAALQPLPRWVASVTLAGSDLVVRGPAGQVARVSGEDRLAAEVSRVLSGPRPATGLGRLGMRWVVEDVRGTAVPAGLRLAYAGPDLRLYEVPEVDPVAAGDPDAPYEPPAWAVLAGDAVAVVALATAVAAGVAAGHTAGHTTRLAPGPGRRGERGSRRAG
jgi:hypothetical protein